MKCCLSGELTIQCAAEHKTELLQALAGAGPFELDTQAVSEVDGAGLQLLIAALKSAARAQIPVHFPPEARGSAVASGLALLGLGQHAWNRED